MDEGTLLDVRDLRIVATLSGTDRTIVSGIDLRVGRGETIGIVGESGSGKSMTAKALIGLLPAGVSATGTAEFGGRNLLECPERELRRLRGSRLGLVLQDPFTMLNPLMRCGRQITEALSLTRRNRAVLRQEASRRLSEVGIDDPHVAERYPFQLSGGMRQRVGIAAALAGDPELLIADEPSTALDVTTQREILALLKSLQRSRGMGLVLITHDLRVAFSMCDRIYVLYAGSILETSPAAAMEAGPLHPYTLGLLLSEPPSDRRLERQYAIDGAVPSPDAVSHVCAFAARCRWVEPGCRTFQPPLVSAGNDRMTACLRISEIQPALAMERTRRRNSSAELQAITGSPLLEVDHLHKVFASGSAGRRHEVVALGGVSLTVGAGESVGLVGESGSGKTTLGRCLVGLESPTSGTIRVDGLDASDYGSLHERQRRLLRRSIQMIFQDPYSSLNPVRTVGSTLREALTMAEDQGGARTLGVPELLERVGLPESYAHRKPIALSGGERQRVAIARALAVRPKLIVCDEPVSALDVSVQAQILNLFSSLREDHGLSYLFITHDLAVVRQVVERVYVLYRGEVVEHGEVGHVLERPTNAYTAKLVQSVPSTDPQWLVS